MLLLDSCVCGLLILVLEVTPSAMKDSQVNITKT